MRNVTEMTRRKLPMRQRQPVRLGDAQQSTLPRQKEMTMTNGGADQT